MPRPVSAMGEVSTSLRANMRLANAPAVFVELIADKCKEIRSANPGRILALRHQPFLDIRRFDSCSEPSCKPGDRLRWRLGRSDDPIPKIRLVVIEARFGNSRQIWKWGNPCSRGHREGAQFSGVELIDNISIGHKSRCHVLAQQGVHHGGGALKGHKAEF